MARCSSLAFTIGGLFTLLVACGGDALPPVTPTAAAGPIVQMAGAPSHPAGAIIPADWSSTSDLPATCGIEAPAVSGTQIGYILLDLNANRVLAEQNPDLPLVPASTTKLATAIVALDLLGPQHRYPTELHVRGRVIDGSLQGDLILKGHGDPSLELADLLDLALQLRVAGIQRVDGHFLIDDTAFPWSPDIDPNQPPHASYNQAVGALSLASKRVDLATLLDLPPSLAPAIQPSAKNQRKQSRQSRALLATKDPGIHAGRVFHWLASADGIVLPEPRRGRLPAGSQLIGLHQSAPLIRLVRDMLVHSNNVMAETIALSAVHPAFATSRETPPLGSLLLMHLRRLMPEVDWCGSRLANGSGLDRAGRLTPRQVAAIIRYGWQHHGLPALLASGGWSGTLAQRFARSDQALRVWAKTGTLNYGSSLAGYLLRRSGQPAAFAILVSDIKALKANAGRTTRPREWHAMARSVQDDLVRGWLDPCANGDAGITLDPSCTQLASQTVKVEQNPKELGSQPLAGQVLGRR